MFWNCLRMFSLKRWGFSAETSFEFVWKYFRWSDEEIQLRRVLKLPYNVFVEAMRGFGWHKYLDCLRIFSLKWWGISAQISFEIFWQYFRWKDEECRLRRFLKLSYNVLVEVMRNFGWHRFWNFLTIPSLKRWRMPAKTFFEIVLECFRWSVEDFRLKRVLKLSENIFVEVMKKSGSDVFWNRHTMFSLKRCGNSAGTNFEIAWQ